MSVVRKLRRSGHSKHYRLEPLVPKDLCLARKMSEVLMDFAGPLLEDLEDETAFESVLSFAVICWNLSFFPEKEQRKMMRDIVDELGKSDHLMRLEAESWVGFFLERKKAFFADDRRMILDYKIVQEKGRERLLVVSTLAKD
jgi:hypothetical protein